VHSGVEFRINRDIKNGFIEKNIQVIDGQEEHHFQEKVKAFSSDNLQEMVSKAGFNIKDSFGDYNLNSLSEDRPRVVIAAINHI
jgi:hypothetical protein